MYAYFPHKKKVTEEKHQKDSLQIKNFVLDYQLPKYWISRLQITKILKILNFEMSLPYLLYITEYSNSISNYSSGDG